MVKKMNPEIKAEWVRRLRSGEYTQGLSRLNINNEKFCCLGVLCEIAVDQGIITKDDTLGSIGYNDGRDRSVFALPKRVQVWSGVSEMGDLDSDDNFPLRSLSGLNDAGKTFDEIATIIEEEL